MDKHMYWTVAIKNSICVICWTILAVVFNKWWIALFGLFFMTSVQSTRYYRICDKCGRRSEYAGTPEEALNKALKAGWIHYDDGNKDYCPHCQ